MAVSVHDATPSTSGNSYTTSVDATRGRPPAAQACTAQRGGSAECPYDVSPLRGRTLRTQEPGPRMARERWHTAAYDDHLWHSTALRGWRWTAQVSTAFR